MRHNDLLLLNLREKRGRFTIEASSLTDNASQRALKFLGAINAYQATKRAHIQMRNAGQGRSSVYCCLDVFWLGTFHFMRSWRLLGISSSCGDEQLPLRQLTVLFIANKKRMSSSYPAIISSGSTGYHGAFHQHNWKVGIE